jgi:hypothetical protein
MAGFGAERALTVGGVGEEVVVRRARLQVQQVWHQGKAASSSDIANSEQNKQQEQYKNEVLGIS